MENDKKKLNTPSDDDGDKDERNNDDTATSYEVKQENPMTRALQIHLVLDNIFDHLSYNDVKTNCALVNKYWNQAVSKNCNKWTLFKILFHCFRNQKTGDTSYKIVLEEGKGGCSEFSGRKNKFFSSTISLTLEELEEKVKKIDRKRIWLSLQIDLYRCRRLRESVLMQDDPTVHINATRLLVMVLPWLTHMTIDDDDSHSTSPEEDVDHFYSLLEDAPELQHLSISSKSLRVLKILQKINLTSIRSLTLPTFSYFTPASISKLLEVTPFVKDIINCPLYFVKIQPSSAMNEKRSISYNHCSGSLHSLQLIADKLKKLEIWPLTSSNQMDFPQLPALTTLVLNYPDNIKAVNDDDVDNFFPPGFNISQKFPNLTRFEIVGLTLTSLSQLDWLLPVRKNSKNDLNSWKSVLYLKIWQCKVSSVIVQMLACFFPNIRTLEVGQSSDWLQDCLPSIWKSWPKLKELSMVVESKFGGIKSLDDVITGISHEECKLLKKQSKKAYIDMDHYKSDAAVSDMKDLQKFSVTFIGSATTVRRGNHLMSHVSAFYGFQLIPDLEVNFRIMAPCKQSKQKNIGRMLELIIPFVNYDPNYIPPFNF